MVLGSRMGYMMDAIAEGYVVRGVIPEEADYLSELELLRDECAWTHGHWYFGEDSLRRWNELQNTPKDINLLTGHLLREYQRLSRQVGGVAR